MAASIAERAERYWRTIKAAMPSLPPGIQTAFGRPLGTSDVSWALSLVLAGWSLLKESDRGDAPEVLQQTGAMPLVNQLNALSVTLPEPFKKALETAEAATGGSFAGAATYLTQAFQDMIDLQRNAVATWVGGQLFREAGASLTRRIQEPGSQLGQTWSLPTVGATPTFQEARRSRLAAFEASERPKRSRSAAPKEAAPDSGSSPSEPAVPPAVVARGVLMSQAGWEAHETERILSGPEGNSGSALGLKRILRTYGGMKEYERQKFRRLVTAREGGFDSSRSGLVSVSVADLRAVRDADALDDVASAESLFGRYSELSLPDRKRMLRWIQNQEPAAFGLVERLPILLASYRALPQRERMRFLKLVDETEQEVQKESINAADVSWEPMTEPAVPELSDAIRLYRVYRRLSVPERASLIRASLQTEQGFNIPDFEKVDLGKIERKDLE